MGLDLCKLCNMRANLSHECKLQMVSDWLKTQKKRPRTNQIRADLTTNLRKNGHGSQQTTIFCKQNNNRKVKKIFQKPEHSKKYVFLAKCIENALRREKYCQQNGGK